MFHFFFVICQMVSQGTVSSVFNAISDDFQGPMGYWGLNLGFPQENHIELSLAPVLLFNNILQC